MPAAKKKPVAKKAATKRPATHRKAAPVRAAQTQSSFMAVRPSIETVYWIVLGAVVIALAAWVLHLTTQIDNLYNQVEINDASNAVVTQPSKATQHEAK